MEGVAVVAGAGHLCNVEAPDRFNAEVRSFLKSVASDIDENSVPGPNPYWWQKIRRPIDPAPDR
jgi:hypothetical protein